MTDLNESHLKNLEPRDDDGPETLATKYYTLMQVLKYGGAGAMTLVLIDKALSTIDVLMKAYGYSPNNQFFAETIFKALTNGK